jgi:EAL domain-containing protein (putative c-di-GMP-specific phosphodiesterase class I)
MRTKSLAATGTALPWLERFVPESSSPEHIEVAKVPFTIGRSEECDYPIASSRVSRTHAEISKAAGAYLLRDLGSTNGTFVNGQKIDQVRLSEGDLVVIADIELTFRTADGNQSGQKTATQVMRQSDSRAADEPEENVSLDLIQAVRGIQESILCRAVRNRYQMVVDLTSGKSTGYEAIQRESPSGRELRTAERLLDATECRLTERLHQLHRLLAVEQAGRLAEGNLLFLPLTAAEVGADSLADSLIRLSRLAGGKQLVAQVPDSAVVDIPYFRDFLSRLRQAHICVAYDGFGGGQQQVGTQQELAPDYLKLAPALARGVDKSSPRQKQIREIVEAASQTDTQVIATGVHTENEAQTCRELGCRLAQGDHYGRPQTMGWPLEGAVAG